jgi:hypothetical protein
MAETLDRTDEKARAMITRGLKKGDIVDARRMFVAYCS